MYKTKVWRQLREAQLQRQPLCGRCNKRGLVEPANVVNHVIPHKGEENLFRDPANLESVCKHCHDSRIHSQELRGYTYNVESDANGMPLDPSHPFYAERK